MPRNKFKTTTAQNGNAFFFVLLGIVLFAALAITVTRGMRGNTTTRLTGKTTEISVSEILTYAQRVSRAVDHVRQRGCSENDISFENGVVTGYDHTPPALDKCKIFTPDGGNVTWTAPPLENLQYEYWGANAVQGVGSTANDLLLILHIPEKSELCAAFNKKLGITGTTNGAGNEDETLFTGEFPTAFAAFAEAPDKNAACVNADGDQDYIIYNVLLER